MRWLCFVSPPPHPWLCGPALSARPGPSSVSQQKLPFLFFHSFLGLFSAGSVNRTGSASGWMRSQMSVRGGVGAAGGRSGTASSAGRGNGSSRLFQPLPALGAERGSSAASAWWLRAGPPPAQASLLPQGRGRTRRGLPQADHPQGCV